MEKIKLLIVSPDYYPAFGGVERFVQDLAEYLVQFPEFEVKVLAGTRVQKLKMLQQDIVNGIEVVRIPTVNPAGLDFPCHPKFYKKIVQLFSWADVIHLNDVRLFFLTALFIGVLKKKILLLTTHGFIFHTRRNLWFKKIYSKFFAWALRHFFRKVFVLGYVDFDFCEQHRIKAVLMENGINLDMYRGVARRPIVGHFLYFGRIDRNKNLDGLFKNLAKYAQENSSFHLYVCGAGDEALSAQLRQLTVEINLVDKVHFLGKVTQEELLNQLALSEIVFIPSKFESFGYTLVESLAAGCTVVANDILQFSRMLSGKRAAYLVDYRSPDQFCAVLKRARESFVSVNTAGIDFSAQYEQQCSLEKYYDYFIKITKE